MKAIIPLLLLWSGFAVAQSERYVTITAVPSATQPGVKASYALAEGETAIAESLMGNKSAYFEKDGAKFSFNNPTGVVVAGPARFVIGGGASESTLLTLKILPDSFAPGRTLVIPADTHGANIIMEASPDLVQWTNALPGVYTNTSGHTFFRIRAQRLP